MTKSERNSNVEFLRILSMLAIIAGHIARQSGDLIYLPTINDFLLVLFSNGHRIAVNIFLLIGTWYMVDAKFESARILKLYFQLYFYTASLSLLMFSLNIDYVQIRSVVVGFMPFIGRALWFATAYICLLLLKPFLDKILEWEKKSLITFTLFIFILLSIFSTLLSKQEGFVCDAIWFAEVYLIVGTIKKNSIKIRIKPLHCLLFAGGGI